MNLEQKLKSYEESILILSEEVKQLKDKVSRLQEINDELFLTMVEQSKKIRAYENMNKVKKI